MLNIPLACKVRGWLVAHPELNDQEVWGARNAECQTVGCVAGIALTLAGYDFKFSTNLTSYERDCGYRESAVGVIKTGFSDELEYFIAQTASSELGLSCEELEYLFYDCASTQEALEYLAILIERAESEEQSLRRKSRA